MPAIPPHRTPTSDASWDGPANERRLKLDQAASYYRRAYAWFDPQGDERTKSAYKFIHHFVSEGGSVGAASVVACRTGIGLLNGARGGTTIPERDRRGVWEHLAQHLRDAGEEPPELREVSEPEVRDGAAIVRKAMAAEVEAHGDNEIALTISTEARDREGDIIRASGWSLEAYTRNPVVLWAHRHDFPPVARAAEIKQRGSALYAIAEFVPADTPVVGPMAEALRRLYREKFMRGVSVGFIPRKWQPLSGGGREFIEQELLEFSLVPVPANAEALARSSADQVRSDDKLVDAILSMCNKDLQTLIALQKLVRR